MDRKDEADAAFESCWQQYVVEHPDAVFMESLARLWWTRGCVFGASQLFEMATELGVIPNAPEVRDAFKRVLAK